LIMPGDASCRGESISRVVIGSALAHIPMSLDNAVSAIGKPYWLDYTDLVLWAGAGWVSTKAESKTIVERFAKELVTRHEGTATLHLDSPLSRDGSHGRRPRLRA